MYGDGPPAESDWISRASTPASPGPAHRRQRPGARRRRPAGAERADRAVAGNAGGRYIHERDDHPAPLDPNFTGAGRCLTDGEGSYRFVSVKPGAYPWRNHPNAWRPAHIHFSVFGRAFTDRLVTQMYFPGDPLFPFDPISSRSATSALRERLISAFDWETTTPEWALGFRFDIVLAAATARRWRPERWRAQRRRRPWGRSSRSACACASSTTWSIPPGGCDPHRRRRPGRR